jgi:hypothetical protein
LFSEQKSRMDYITLNGIRDRTGFDEDLYQFVIKELLDNAVDDLEKKYVATRTTNNDIPKVRVSISTYSKTSGSDGKNYKYLEKVKELVSIINDGYV